MSPPRLAYIVAGLVAAALLALVAQSQYETIPSSSTSDTESLPAQVPAPKRAPAPQTPSEAPARTPAPPPVSLPVPVRAPAPAPAPARREPLKSPALRGPSRRVGKVHPSDPTCFEYDRVPGRCAPHWVIIGALKCGTTSVYSWLGRHPNVTLLGDMNEDEQVESSKWAADMRETRPLHFKEIGFFKSSQTDADLNRYLRYFPPITPGSGRMTGEGSVQYAFMPSAPDALATWLPAARLILLLRDPVERMFSRYQHTSTLFLTRPGASPLAWLGDSPLAAPRKAATQLAIEVSALVAKRMVDGSGPCTDSFMRDESTGYESLMSCWVSANSAVGTAVARELEPDARQAVKLREAIASGTQDLPAGHPLLPFFPAVLTTLVRLKSLEHSTYYPQVHNFLRYYDSSRLLIVRSEDLFSNPVATMDEIAAFVDLPHIDWAPVCEVKYNALRDDRGRVTLVPETPKVAAKYPFEPSARNVLERYFAPLNAALGKLLDRDMGWHYDS